MAVAFLVYLLIGIVAFWPVYPAISHYPFSDLFDFTQTVWFLGWVPHALAHGVNPFFSNALYVPTGVNLAQNTSSPLLGWITAPLAPVFSPVVRANLLLVLGMPISATAAFVVLRKWQVWGPAAALGGLVYGFSPYMVGQSISHLELIFVPLPPFIALTVASILQNKGSSRRLGVQLGLLVAAQYLISPEVLSVLFILTIAASVCVAILSRAHVREMVKRASGATGVALAVTAVLLAYPLWMSFYGPQHFTGPPWSTTNPYHNDLLSFLVPGPHQRISLGMRSIGNRLLPEIEADGYIGVPVLIVAGILAWWSRRRLRTQLALVLTLIAVLLSLGPHLAIDGRLTDIPLPDLLLDHLPLLNGILPSRISFGVDACLAAVIAFGLDDVRQTPEWRWIRGWRSTLVALVTLAVLVATQLPEWPEPFRPQSAIALPAALTQAIPAGDPVAITYPYDIAASDEPMLWQVEDDFRFRLLGGYAYHPYSSDLSFPILEPRPMNPPGTQQFLTNQEGSSFFGKEMPVDLKLVGVTRSTVSRYDIRLVIVDRSMTGSAPVMELFRDALGPPQVSAGHFSMWTNSHDRPGRKQEQFSRGLSTKLVLPANDAKLSGTTPLDAVAKAYYRISKVEYLLTDEDHHSKVIAEGIPSPLGAIARWNTTSVANGTYSLQSVVYDELGGSSRSTAITVTIRN